MLKNQIKKTKQKPNYINILAMIHENRRTTKGTGLGLYLCKKIMEKHHGKILVNDNHPVGTIFTATFNIS